jgi:hypothetical protein
MAKTIAAGIFMVRKDDYKWVSLDEARVILHNTQSACIDKIKELLYGNN